MSFTKLCVVLYNQITCCKPQTYLMNCYIALGCIAWALPCGVAPRYTAHHELHWYVRTGRTNSMYKHLCERHPSIPSKDTQHVIVSTNNFSWIDFTVWLIIIYLATHLLSVFVFSVTLEDLFSFLQHWSTPSAWELMHCKYRSLSPDHFVSYLNQFDNLM